MLPPMAETYLFKLRRNERARATNPKCFVLENRTKMLDAINHLSLNINKAMTAITRMYTYSSYKFVKAI